MGSKPDGPTALRHDVMASQDAWAAPLAVELVDLFRVSSFTYIRTTAPVYDPVTGEVTSGRRSTTERVP